MSYVKLSKTEAQAVEQELNKSFRSCGLSGFALRALNRIHDQLKYMHPKRAPKPMAVERKKKQAAKKATKREQRADVRALVMARANGRCECGAGRVDGTCAWSFEGGPLEMDHFFGKARSESVESCWALSPRCHLDKTKNQPGAGYWLDLFSKHCQQHGYVREFARARTRLACIVAVRVREANRG